MFKLKQIEINWFGHVSKMGRKRLLYNQAKNKKKLPEKWIEYIKSKKHTI